MYRELNEVMHSRCSLSVSYFYLHHWASLVAQLVKNLPAVQEIQVQFLGRSPGEGNGNALQYSFLENPMDREVWKATVHGVLRVGHNLATKPPPPLALLGELFLY